MFANHVFKTILYKRYGTILKQLNIKQQCSKNVLIIVKYKISLIVKFIANLLVNICVHLVNLNMLKLIFVKALILSMDSNVYLANKYYRNIIWIVRHLV
jgi:hypothetical protein